MDLKSILSGGYSHSCQGPDNTCCPTAGFWMGYGIKDLKFQDKVGISSHLKEAKDRMIQVTIVVLIFCCQLLFYWYPSCLVGATPPRKVWKTIFYYPTEPFLQIWRLPSCVPCSFPCPLFFSPVAVYCSWPEGKRKENYDDVRDFRHLVFVFGGAFCYFLVVPIALKFLMNYGVNFWNFQVTIGFYFRFWPNWSCHSLSRFRPHLLWCCLQNLGWSTPSKWGFIVNGLFRMFCSSICSDSTGYHYSVDAGCSPLRFIWIRGYCFCYLWRPETAGPCYQTDAAS